MFANLFFTLIAAMLAGFAVYFGMTGEIFGSAVATGFAVALSILNVAAFVQDECKKISKKE